MMGRQREQQCHGREMGVAMMTMVMMPVVMTVPAAAFAAVFLRLAFIQREVLAYTDVVFAHM